MKTFYTVITGITLLVAVLLVQSCSTRVEAGPNGGDVVSLNDGDAKAELLANSETGEVLVHTWDEDLKSPQPIEAKTLTLGTEDNQMLLEPHPLSTDPPGYCSRFYGRADWARGGNIHHGWLGRSADQTARRHFDWDHSWKAGRQHGSMWAEMGGRGRGMQRGGMGHE